MIQKYTTSLDYLNIQYIFNQELKKNALLHVCVP